MLLVVGGGVDVCVGVVVDVVVVVAVDAGCCCYWVGVGVGVGVVVVVADVVVGVLVVYVYCCVVAFVGATEHVLHTFTDILATLTNLKLNFQAHYPTHTHYRYVNRSIGVMEHVLHTSNIIIPFTRSWFQIDQQHVRIFIFF